MTTPQVIILVLGGLLLAVLLLGRAGSRPARGPRLPLPPVEVDVATRMEIDRLVAANQKIAAIKLLREATGLGLRDAKDAVESGSYTTGTVRDRQQPAASDDPAPTEVLAIEARAVRQASGAITAVKFVRERTGWGLAEAKAYVDRLAP